MHFPVIALGATLLREHAHLPAVLQLLAMQLVVTPIAVMMCYGFHLLFERPFQTSAQPMRIALEFASTAENMRTAA
jgi:hypothetical protein